MLKHRKQDWWLPLHVLGFHWACTALKIVIEMTAVSLCSLLRRRVATWDLIVLFKSEVYSASSLTYHRCSNCSHPLLPSQDRAVTSRQTWAVSRVLKGSDSGKRPFSTPLGGQEKIRCRPSCKWYKLWNPCVCFSFFLSLCPCRKCFSYTAREKSEEIDWKGSLSSKHPLYILPRPIALGEEP